jgi:hypothetical protein
MRDGKPMVVPIARLRALYPLVERVSQPMPESPDQRSLECSGAECPNCKMTVSASELLQLAKSESDIEIRDPLLRRLYDGQCIKLICESSEYTVWFVVRQEADWVRLENEMHAQVELTRVSQADQRSVSRRRQLLMLFGGIIGTVVLFFGLRYWIFGYRIPLIQKKRTFRLAPQNPAPRPSE